LAGNQKGSTDPRGKLFYEYVRVIRDKQPKIFVAENVPGIVSVKHHLEFLGIVEEFALCGYSVKYRVLNAETLGVPQSRERVIIVGSRIGDADEVLNLIELDDKTVTLKNAIGDLIDPIPALDKNKTNGVCPILNHEYFIGGFSSRYMSRNRMRGWDEVSFTIQASGRHAPLHPSSGGMRFIGVDVFEFTCPEKIRRMSVRECARIQTFPDDFEFLYTDVGDGYKMIGNAVPVMMAEAIAKAIGRVLK
jgi:DNA (cytosine-5)-methyltransferase 1